MPKVLSLSLLFALLFPCYLSAQPCTADEVRVTIVILTDRYPEELSWDLTGLNGTVYAEVNLDGTYQEEKLYTWEVCLPKLECSTFTIYDSYGDGIETPGYYAIMVDGVTIVQSYFAGDKESQSVNCAPGFACNNPLDIGLGEYLAPHDNSWYEFVPTDNGQYQISTCNLSVCDTKIWVFTSCSQAHNNEQNEGTLAYDDDFGACGEQAQVAVGMEAGQSYYIRIGDDHDDCAGQELRWSLEYMGPIEGCTDPNSCNYNPLATVNDGSCIPFGDPACPMAPDLVISQDLLTSSAYLAQIQAIDPCLIEEGCLQGYGIRDVIRFSTRIDNRGDADYFIGVPGPNNPQFTFDNCHNHWHYDGYAEYILFNEFGQEIPIGFKNGFCVLDLGCLTGGEQYSCEMMGISAGCYDEYWAELECQWIDITDIPDGAYTFVTRVNWDNAPDALGRRETDTLNNWAQMCIVLSRASGTLKFSQVEDCPPYVDCAGILYGNTQLDCEGDCGGTVKFGDLNKDGKQETTDAERYIDGILNQSLVANNCTDLSANGTINVYDAALLSACALFGENHPNPNTGPQNFCRFPHNVLNTNHFAGLSILDYDLDQKYFDIGIRTPSSNIVAYQFVMSGLTISALQNLMDTLVFPITPYTDGDSMVLGLSLQDSLIHRSTEWQPLVRVFYEAPLAEEVCISEIIDIVNENYERISVFFEDPCILLSTATLETPNELQCQVMPNPFGQYTRLSFSNPQAASYELRVSDISGRLLQRFTNITGEEILIQAADLPKGLCLYALIGEKGMATGKLIVE